MLDAAREAGTHVRAGVADARAALLAWVDAAGDAGRIFLEANLRRSGDGLYAVRHHRDLGLAADALDIVSADPFRARKIAQTTAAGEHRPLKTAPNLRRGWLLHGLSGAGLWTTLDYLYPACAVHWYAASRGVLRVTDWPETAARQSGMYGAVGLLSPEGVRDAVAACCDDSVCLRRVAWGTGETPAAVDAAAAPSGSVPCPEACSLFISLARKALALERSPRSLIPGLGELGPKEVGQLREIVGAAAAGTLSAVREGDFAEPANRRRMRLLAQRLERAAPPAAASSIFPCEGCPRPVRCAGCPIP